jgi:hypothetical protein
MHLLVELHGQRGGGLTGVSCPPAGSCVGVVFGGGALAVSR